MPLATKPISELSAKDKARFLSKISAPDSNGCHRWKASLDSKGYGHIWIQGSLRIASRVAWTVHFGSIPNGLQVLHRCDNRYCCNPSHLFLGTHEDNMADKKNKGRVVVHRGDNHYARKSPWRMARGDKHGTHTKPESVNRLDKHINAKLTNNSALYIKSMRGKIPIKTLCLIFGVSKATVSGIQCGTRWASITAADCTDNVSECSQQS